MRKKLCFMLAASLALSLCGCSEAPASSDNSTAQSTTDSTTLSAPENNETFDPIRDQIEALGEATPRVISDETENYVISLEFGEYSNGSYTYDIALSLSDNDGIKYSTSCRSPALGGAPAISNTLPQDSEFILKAEETDVFPLFAAVLVPFTMQSELKYYTTLYCFDGSTLDIYFPEGKEGTFFPIITDPESIVIGSSSFTFTDENGELTELNF